MSVTLSKFIKCFLDSQNMHEALKFKQAIKKIAWHFFRSADFGIFGGRGREREREQEKRIPAKKHLINQIWAKKYAEIQENLKLHAVVILY